MDRMRKNATTAITIPRMIIAMTKPIECETPFYGLTFDKKSTVFNNSCQIILTLRGFVILLLFLLVQTSSFAGELFDRGAEAFLYSRPQEAATIMEQVIAQDPVNARAYLYLAMSYEQLAMYERAITTLKRSVSVPGIDRGLVLFNIGNNYLHLGDSGLAEASYSEAIEESPASADPYLNRANVRVMTEQFELAVEDYLAVLGIQPNHPQRLEIERMIALLRDHVETERLRVEQERLRLEAEAQRLKDEEERLQREAEERRRALLSNVLDSIRTATD
ncbi:MAG: tetratricopeptide repeat protein, partial [Spirochaetales bacterium]